MMKSLRAFYLVVHLLIFSAGYQAHAANNPAYQQRQTNYIDTCLAHYNGFDIMLQAYRGLPVDTPTLNALLNSIATGLTSDFDIVELVRILYFSSGQYDGKILPVLNAVPYWINSGDTTRVFWSENHMSMWMSSEWLLHEKYGKVVDNNLRKRLVHYLHLKIQYGYYEFYSSVYNPYCLTGLLNLADFAQDTEIQTLARQAAQRLMTSLLQLTTDKGVFFPPAGRNYSGKYETPYGQNHNNLIHLLSGLGPAPGSASHAGCFLATSNIPVDTVIATWTSSIDTVIRIGHTIQEGLALNDSMSAVDSIIFGWSAGEYFHPLLALATFNLLTDSNLWQHPDFGPFKQLSVLPPENAVPLANELNCASESSVLCDDTIAIYKHNSISLASVQDYWPGKMGYQQYPCVAAVETTAVYTASGAVLPWDSRPASGANDDLPYVKQIKNVALLMYRPQFKQAILGASNPQVTLHWTDADFTEIRNDSMWLLGRVDNNYVAVRRSCTGYIDTFRACSIPNGQAWVIMVGDSATYGDFNSFQQVVDSSQFIEQWYYDTANSQEVFYAKVVVSGTTVEHAWGRDSTLPSAINSLAPAPVFNIFPNPASTVLNVELNNNLQAGKLEIYNTAGQIVYQSAVSGKTMAIPTGGLSEGIYAIRVLSDANNASTKCFIVSH